LSILWYSATVADAVAVVNASAACNDSWGKESSGGVSIDCNGEDYGITIAVDCAISITVLVLWIIFCVLRGGPGTNDNMLENKV
jgi:hypothetical protein